MKNFKINSTTVVALIAGLVLGWMFFAGTETPPSAHVHDMNESGKWTCSMHPLVQQDAAGKCPFCGMDLIPLVTETQGSEARLFSMSDHAVKLANIQTIEVASGTSGRRVRMTGRIEIDEGQIKSQVLHIPGRIERLFIEYTGQAVKAGDRIATIYSPQLVTAQKELREALRLETQYPQLVASARKKFENWKLSPAQISQIEEATDVITNFDIVADVSGVITNKNVQLGDHVMQGGILFEVSDLAQVWAIFDIYEQDLQGIKMRDPVEFNVKALPGKTFTGRVDFIDPIIDAATRTASVRLTVPNKGGQLKPEMLIEGYVSAAATVDENLMVPRSAVLWTGRRSLVYVQPDPTHPAFEMREVVLGNMVNGQYIIENGLETGEYIVVNGTFAIDAAAQLQGKQSMMNPVIRKASTGHQHHEMGATGASAKPEQDTDQEQFEVAQEFKDQVQEIFKAYLPFKDALIETNRQTALDKARPLLEAIENVDMGLVDREAHMAWMKDFAVLKDHVNEILEGQDIAAIRTRLSPLSDQLYETLLKFGVETGGYRQYCPMAFDFKGAFWLSDSDQVLNPYFGDEMLTCGSVEEELN